MQWDGLRFAQVENLKTEFLPGAGQDAFQGISDVGVIAGAGAIAENGDGLSGGDQAGEFVNGQVRPLPRTVHGEKAEHRDVQTISVVIGMPQRFTGQLGGGIGGNGRENGIAFREGDLGVDAVNGGRRGQNELLNTVPAGGLQEEGCALHIDPHVKGGVLEAGPHPGAGRQMNDLIKADGGKKLIDTIRIRKVALDEFEPSSGLG